MYYIYAYLRSNGTPYYIGKGKNKRAWSKNHTINLPSDISKIVILEENLTEIGAMALERRLIRWWGRKDNGTGILRNHTDGGDGVSGIKFSETTKKIRSYRMIGNTIAKNTKYTKEMCESRSIRALGNQNAKGGKSRTGQIPSQRQRILNSLKHKGTRWWNNGIQNKKSKICPGIDYRLGRI